MDVEINQLCGLMVEYMHVSDIGLPTVSHGLYIFYPIFHCGLYSKAAYITDSLCTKTR